MPESQTCPEPDNPIDERITALIRWKARSLVGRAGLTFDDRPDVEQELTLRLLEPLLAFDGAKRTRLSYAQLLIDRFAINLLRDRRAAKRDGGPHAPLPADLPAPEVAGGADRALDVGAALEALPEELRAVAELMKTETVTDAARALGVSRDTVYARLRELRGRAAIRKAAVPPPAPYRSDLPEDPVAFARGLLAGAFGPADVDPAHPHHAGWLVRAAAFLGTRGDEHQAWLRRARELDPRAYPDAVLLPADEEVVRAALDAVMRRG